MKKTNVFLLLGDPGSADAEERDAWVLDLVGGMRSRRGDFRFEIVGTQSRNDTDRTAALKELIGDRGNVVLSKSRGLGFPLWSALRAVRAELAQSTGCDPDIVIGVGSLRELLVILLSPRLRKAKRLLCLLRDGQDRGIEERWYQRIFWPVRTELFRTADAVMTNSEKVATQLRRGGIEATLIADRSGEQMDRFDRILSGLLGLGVCPDCDQLRTKIEVLKAMLQDEMHANLVDEIAIMQGVVKPAKPSFPKS